jgi:hypothetical protein
MEKKRNQGALLNSQHFKGRMACLNSRMGLKSIHKQKFKIKLAYTTKERRWLVQVECKWYDGLGRDNLKHKFYMAHNL